MYCYTNFTNPLSINTSKAGSNAVHAENSQLQRGFRALNCRHSKSAIRPSTPTMKRSCHRPKIRCPVFQMTRSIVSMKELFTRSPRSGFFVRFSEQRPRSRSDAGTKKTQFWLICGTASCSPNTMFQWKCPLGNGYPRVNPINQYCEAPPVVSQQSPGTAEGIGTLHGTSAPEIPDIDPRGPPTCDCRITGTPLKMPSS